MMERAPGDYLRWYYETNVWKRLSYRGVRTLKLPLDMWNYQEIIFEHDLHWVLETGTRHGGSALFFADLLRAGAREGCVVSVDVTHEALHPLATAHPKIRLVLGDSTAPETIAALRQLIPPDRSRAMLLILDSDHAAPHVLRELDVLVPLLRQGDYVVVEDTIVNGHPVRPGFGPGPLEAVDAYLRRNPGRLIPDSAREAKFGCTFAYRGYYRICA
jgi:cephalosporin hydroxylase